MFSPDGISPPSPSRSAACAPAASAWADAGSFAIGRFSIVPTKATHRAYAFPAIWVQAGNRKPVARVLESRLQPPFTGSSGLGSNNAPGLTRLASATFTGEFPLARVDFADSALPVKVSLEAFSPFIPHEPDESGLPVAILRYRVTNPGPAPAKVSIAWSIENPTGHTSSQGHARQRIQVVRAAGGHLDEQPGTPADDPLKGSFVLSCAESADGAASPTCADGSAAAGGTRRCSTGTISPPMGNSVPSRRILDRSARSASAEPSRPAPMPITPSCWPGIFPIARPRRCGWSSAPGDEDILIGNYYTTRFADAWAAAEYAAEHLATRWRRRRAASPPPCANPPSRPPSRTPPAPTFRPW